MRIARVVGNVVSTIKDASYAGYKLMIVDYLDDEQRMTGNRVIAFDGAQAGIGDVVLVAADGGAAMEVLRDKDVVADVAICGVLDRIDYGGVSKQYV